MKEKTKWYGGIDNGLDGGLAFINDMDIVHLYNMPTLNISSKRSKKTGKLGKKRVLDIAEIMNIISQYEPLEVVTVEAMQVSGHSGKFHQSATSIATSHRNGGIILGILAGMGVAYIEILASVWQKKFFTAKSKKDTKMLSYLNCCKLYPTYIKEFKGKQGGVKDGLCDALLIATYGRRWLK